VRTLLFIDSNILSGLLSVTYQALFIHISFATFTMLFMSLVSSQNATA
jgi:hypothetical protein